MSACGMTVKVAVMVAVFVPTEVFNEPAGIVFVPLEILVTTTDTEHETPGGTTVPVPTIKELAPGVAVSAGLAQVLVANGADELLILAG
jgi:hypothetical protein